MQETRTPGRRRGRALWGAAMLATLLATGCRDAGSAEGGTTAARGPFKLPALEGPALRMSPVVTRNQDEYALPPEQKAGPYYVVNNTWGTGKLPAGWSQQVGLSTLQPDGSVSCRFVWDYPATVPGQDVMAYPECIYGLSIPGQKGRAPASDLPRRVAELKGLSTRAAGVTGTVRGMGHLSYDLWLTRSDSEMIESRATEIMMPVIVFGGYGIPEWPAEAAKGREAQIVKGQSGRNPKGYKGRATIGGAVYDLYYDPPTQPKTRPDGRSVLINSQGQPWTFIVLEPVSFAGAGPHTVAWGPIFDALAERGWIDRQHFLPGVELGYEPFGAGAQGDLTVVGFKVEVAR